MKADDIIATLALQAEKANFEVLIVSRDKDLLQLVNESIFLYEAGGKNKPAEKLDEHYVETKFNIKPNQVKDLLALMGDSSDNIPGISKVGIKTAAKLLNTYGTLKNIYKKFNFC